MFEQSCYGYLQVEPILRQVTHITKLAYKGQQTISIVGYSLFMKVYLHCYDG